MLIILRPHRSSSDNFPNRSLCKLAESADGEGMEQLPAAAGPLRDADGGVKGINVSITQPPRLGMWGGPPAERLRLRQMGEPARSADRAPKLAPVACGRLPTFAPADRAAIVGVGLRAGLPAPASRAPTRLDCRPRNTAGVVSCGGT